SIIYLENTSFDILINLDKDREACGLANKIQAKEKFGYMLKDGVPHPANKLAEHKLSTGIFDDISIANTKSYVEEIFEIAGWKFADEEYVFDNHDDKGFLWMFDKSKKLIGLNTGCGDRWTTRLWSEKKWLELIASLKEKGYEPVLLGGQQEDEKNIKLSKASGALYPGYFSLPQFINLANQMDVIVSQVTMAMHIAVGLRKRLILMNNIFNPDEFYLYKRGQMVSPSKKCDCFYRGSCIHGTSCMEDLAPDKVMEAIENSLKH
ncbi:MAG TPA: glycosyltransferase family 9 protein, partial [Cytophagaceae bacterium]|nr:glycosyltransferase family 9 protein [Cytophagaceae bacterium]